MTVDNDITSARALVAIDIAKHTNEVLIQRPGKAHRQRLKIPNTGEGYGRLIDHLRGLGCPVQIGFEATGNYHRSLAWRLLQAGFELRLISSLALARTREARHNGWDKNDPKDAQVMLHMLEMGTTQRRNGPRFLDRGLSGISARVMPQSTCSFHRNTPHRECQKFCV